MARKRLIIIESVLRAISGQIEDHPNMEVCGLLGGVGEMASVAIPIPNISSNNLTHFQMDPQSQVDGMMLIERSGQELVGIYHSHPAGSRSDPSPTDVNQWAYPDAACVIILADDNKFIDSIKAFSIQSGNVEVITVVSPKILE